VVERQRPDTSLDDGWNEVISEQSPEEDPEADVPTLRPPQDELDGKTLLRRRDSKVPTVPAAPEFDISEDETSKIRLSAR